jgi:hypothetical protein
MPTAHHATRRCKTRTRTPSVVPACPICESPSERLDIDRRRCTHRMCGHVFTVEIAARFKAAGTR